MRLRRTAPAVHLPTQDLSSSSSSNTYHACSKWETWGPQVLRRHQHTDVWRLLDSVAYVVRSMLSAWWLLLSSSSALPGWRATKLLSSHGAWQICYRRWVLRWEPE